MGVDTVKKPLVKVLSRYLFLRGFQDLLPDRFTFGRENVILLKCFFEQDICLGKAVFDRLDMGPDCFGDIVHLDIGL